MLKARKGLKYPDEYFIKFFFKTELDKQSDFTFLEFGCGNGNNLLLPYQYGNHVVGVDLNASSIEHANDNFTMVQNEHEFQFYAEDMRDFVLKHKSLQADVFLLPSVACYITRADFIQFLQSVKCNQLIKSSVPFYIRLRTPKDYRFGLGEALDKQTFKMPTPSGTGEDGALMVFYDEWELIDLLREHIQLKNFKVFSLDCQNEQAGKTILNSDIVIWGEVNG
ncbi:hypothetical protein MNBD_GAMMA04-24 [hydrothermal vent metagenome]|uniref:Methyltransferase domain-containing protein n=1 Tax=hydrothermal vent metagenome TaxID=652676 RepID=A0A3B0WBX2_9ZZZZ